jgi:uncharacterized protein YdeI (YjbR/CyaY-like superfamily)
MADKGTEVSEDLARALEACPPARLSFNELPADERGALVKFLELSTDERRAERIDMIVTSLSRR